MAFGTDSKIFSSFITDCMNNTAAFDLNSDTINVALFDNTGTPDQTVASAAAAFNADQWDTANEVTATGWPTGGLALTVITSGFTGTVYTFDANDRVGGLTDTIVDARGVLIYDTTLAAPVADQAICYNAFGGAAGVTGGSFTVIFHASGILTWTV